MSGRAESVRGVIAPLFRPIGRRLLRHHGTARFGSPQATGTDRAGLSRGAAQYRGGAGAAGRDPGQNEALYRVSDFLEPPHFYEPIHQQIYDVARSLIRTGKLASPVTLKTFLPADIDIAGLTLPQYLARLAAEATTIINAVDY